MWWGRIETKPITVWILQFKGGSPSVFQHYACKNYTGILKKKKKKSNCDLI